MCYLACVRDKTSLACMFSDRNILIGLWRAAYIEVFSFAFLRYFNSSLNTHFLLDWYYLRPSGGTTTALCSLWDTGLCHQDIFKMKTLWKLDSILGSCETARSASDVRKSHVLEVQWKHKHSQHSSTGQGSNHIPFSFQGLIKIPRIAPLCGLNHEPN